MSGCSSVYNSASFKRSFRGKREIFSSKLAESKVTAFESLLLFCNACERSAKVTVNLSSSPIIESIDIIDFSDNNIVTINVSGLGDYEYSLDGVYFQSENIFTQVLAGEYTISVRDIKNNCGTINELIYLYGAPKFFTPNNDGYNDTWQITSIRHQPNANIFIFDRFGKVIAGLNPLSIGWDGTYIGKKLPATDYWFTVSLLDRHGNPVIHKGHFSLVRR